MWEYAGVDVSGLTNLARGQDRMAARDGVQRGLKGLTHGDLTWEEVLEAAPKMVVR